MNVIFRKLPKDIIYYILLYNEHFTIRKGEIISIIPKTDYRYKLLNFITLKLYLINNSNNTIRYRYFFHNLYNYEGRKIYNSDLLEITINEYNENIKYTIWIGKQYPKSVICNKKQDYYVEKPLEYNWIYTQFEYFRN